MSCHTVRYDLCKCKGAGRATGSLRQAFMGSGLMCFCSAVGQCFTDQVWSKCGTHQQSTCGFWLHMKLATIACDEGRPPYREAGLVLSSNSMQARGDGSACIVFR